MDLGCTSAEYVLAPNTPTLCPQTLPEEDETVEALDAELPHDVASVRGMYTRVGSLGSTYAAVLYECILLAITSSIVLSLASTSEMAW